MKPAFSVALNASSDYVREKLGAIREVRRRVQNDLAALVTEKICDVPPADGAFYFLLRVHSPRSSMEMAERLIREHGVAVIPGNAFGLTQGCYLRVAYGALQQETAPEAIGRLVRGLRALA